MKNTLANISVVIKAFEILDRESRLLDHCIPGRYCYIAMGVSFEFPAKALRG